MPDCDRLEIQKEGKPGNANYRQQTKTYELEDTSTLVVFETSASADAPASNPQAIRLKKSN